MSPLRATAGDDSTIAPVVNRHNSVPFTLCRAYTFESSQPKYTTEPSTLSAGDDRMLLPAVVDHSSASELLYAYSFLSSFPTYTTPLLPIVAEASNGKPPLTD